MNGKQIAATELETENQPCSVVNEGGEVVWANREAAKIRRTTVGGLVGTEIEQLVPEMSLRDGKLFERILSGESFEFERELLRDDGSTFFADVSAEPIEIDGDVHCFTSYEKASEGRPPTETSLEMEPPDPTNIDDISEAELQEITQNIRVDAPSGKMPLNAIMLDLAAGHNELEQYKKGSLALYKTIDERLQEEEQKNTDSKTIKVLEAVKRSAFGLYLRLKRGDEELHGHRGGRYSGYFNPS